MSPRSSCTTLRVYTSAGQSVLATYARYRYGGAVTDESIVAQSSPSTQSFKDQVNNFLEGYADNSAVPWTADDSLFTVFIGP